MTDNGIGSVVIVDVVVWYSVVLVVWWCGGIVFQCGNVMVWCGGTMVACSGLSDQLGLCVCESV